MCHSLATAASGMFWGTVQCTRWPYPVSSSVVLVAWEWRLVSYCSCTEDVTSVKYRSLAKEQKVSCKVKDVCSFTFNSLYIHVCQRLCTYVTQNWHLYTCRGPHNGLWCICSAQSGNLRNLEIALHVLRILRLRSNLEIVQVTHAHYS